MYILCKLLENAFFSNSFSASDWHWHFLVIWRIVVLLPAGRFLFNLEFCLSFASNGFPNPIVGIVNIAKEWLATEDVLEIAAIAKRLSANAQKGR